MPVLSTLSFDPVGWFQLSAHLRRQIFLSYEYCLHLKSSASSDNRGTFWDSYFYFAAFFEFADQISRKLTILKHLVYPLLWRQKLGSKKSPVDRLVLILKVILWLRPTRAVPCLHPRHKHPREVKETLRNQLGRCIAYIHHRQMLSSQSRKYLHTTSLHKD